MAQEGRDSCHVANNQDQNMEMREMDKKKDGWTGNRRGKRKQHAFGVHRWNNTCTWMNIVLKGRLCMAKEVRDRCHVANNEDRNMEMREMDKKSIDGHEIGGRNG